MKFRGNDWDEIRTIVKQRDNNTCQKCGKTERFKTEAFNLDFLDVHHIIPYKDTQDNSLENLITLCDSCHKIADNNYLRYGMTNYVRQLIEKARTNSRMIEA